MSYKDYGYVIKALMTAVANKAKDIDKYEAIALMREKELEAAKQVAAKARAEQEQLVDTINLLQPLDRGSVEES